MKRKIPLLGCSSSYIVNLLSFTLLSIFCGVCIGLFIYTEILLTPFRNPVTGIPDELGDRPYQDITLQTQDGLSISAWHIDGPRSEAIILVHGIHANRRAMMAEARILAGAGYQLLMLDLRGHGNSDSAKMTYGYDEAWDVVAAVDYLAVHPNVSQIGILGTSFGGASVARAAAYDNRLQAVVIQSSFSSLPQALEDAFDDLSPLPAWPFAPIMIFIGQKRLGLDIEQVNSARDLAKVSPRHLLIIHGVHDHLFPVEHAQAMYNAANEPKTLWLVEDMGHINVAIVKPEQFQAHVLPFFENSW